jgi:hypothetical protein
MNDKISSVLTTSPSQSPDILWTLEDSNVTKPQLGKTVPMRLKERESLRMRLNTIPQASNGSLLLQDDLENNSRQELIRCNNSSSKPGALSTVIGCKVLFSTLPAFWLPYGVDDEARRHGRGFSLFQDSFWLNPFAPSSIKGLMLLMTSVVFSKTAPLPRLADSCQQQCIEFNDIDTRRET